MRHVRMVSGSHVTFDRGEIGGNLAVVCRDLHTFTCSLICVLAGLSFALQTRAEVSIPEKGTHVVLLGTAGGPVIRKYRSQPSAILTVDGQSYLIDAGDGVLRQLALSGLGAADIEAIFISHLHPDHVADLGNVTLFAKMGGKLDGPKVYGPVGVNAWLRKIDIAVGTIHELGRSGVVLQDDKVKVVAAENSHYAIGGPISPANPAEKSFAFRFETADRTIVFTGDTGPSDTVVELARRADLLISEVMDVAGTVELAQQAGAIPAGTEDAVIEHFRKQHLTPEEVGRLAAAADVGSVLLTHVAPGSDDEDHVGRYVDGVRLHFSGRVVLGKDLGLY